MAWFMAIPTVAPNTGCVGSVPSDIRWPWMGSLLAGPLSGPERVTWISVSFPTLDLIQVLVYRPPEALAADLDLGPYAELGPSKDGH